MSFTNTDCQGLFSKAPVEVTTLEERISSAPIVPPDETPKSSSVRTRELSRVTLLSRDQLTSRRSETTAWIALPIAVARKLGAMNFSCATLKCQVFFGTPSTPTTSRVTGITGAFADWDT